MIKDKIAIFRYGLIAPVIHESQQIEYFRVLSQKTFDVPGHGRKKYSVATFKKWLIAYRKYGIEGLKPKPRNDKDTFKLITPELENIIKSAISDYQPVSCSHLYRLLISENHISDTDFSCNTLRKYVRKHQLLAKTDKTPRKKFEKENINELWISDFMYGPYINKKRTYLCAIIDDHSRLITGYGWYYSESSLSLELTLKQAMARYGLPKVFYCDNGSAYVSDNLKYSCAKLGIALVFATPYQPQGKGKIERFNRTVRQMYLPNGDFSDLESLNESFTNWLEKEYNYRSHSSTKQSPMNRYLSGMDRIKVNRVESSELDNAFWHQLNRKVKKDGTISFKSKSYEVPAKYIGEKVTISYASEKPEELYINNSKLRLVNLSENANLKPESIFRVMEESDV